MKANTISARLRWARQQRGLSRRKLSLDAGISQARVGQIERNNNANPGASVVARIADALGCDVAWLLTGVGIPFPDATDAA